MNLEQIIRESKSTKFIEVFKARPANGLIMEFGVATGGSIRTLASQTTETVYGFDSFEGLPEAWNSLPAGHFNCKAPDVPSNVVLVQGLFQDTVPSFIQEHSDPVSFIHIDCDLYSSTKYVFDMFKDRFQDGSVIAFDEIINYNTWEDHEYKAFNEFIQETKYQYECIGTYGQHQAGFIIHR